MKDLDLELYNKYMNGEKNAFETLYNKYKNKIQYFIFNIVKNNERGGNLTSEATIKSMYNGLNEETRFFYFDDDFVIFMKEKDKSMPYFALKVDNFDILVKENENK